MSTFSYVFIPADLTTPVTVQVASKDGGLENDALRKNAEGHFSSSTSSEFREQQDKLVNDMFAAKGVTAQGSYPGLAASVEIIVLQLPYAGNGFVGVSMYCDQNGKLKNLDLNTRASSLAQTCGHANQVFGDAFIGRYHDDENFPWDRLDFDITDMSSDAAWVADARARNSGKSYSTSGVLQNMLQSNNTAVINDAPEPTTMARNAYSGDSTIDEHLQWSQTGEEVELKVKLSADVKKTDLAVKIQSKKIQITVKTDASLAESNPIFSTNGAALWGGVDTDCSAWTLEKNSSGNVVVVCTLAKSKQVSWPQIFA